MNIGDEVVVLGNLDQRVREKLTEGLVFGTVEQFLVDGQVSIILENMDLWVGPENMVRPRGEQE